MTQLADLKSAVEAASQRFTERNPASLELHEWAVKQLPGGNTRTLLHTAPFPVSMKSGKEYKVWDEDGHEYVDFVGELTAGLYGHSNSTIHSAISSTLSDVGLNLSSNTIHEVKYASLLCSRFNLERVRFTNSGTEASLHAVAGAKRATGRTKVVVFGGAYHGAVLGFDADGKEIGNTVDKGEWIGGEYNDVDRATELIEQEIEGGIAAVLVEGMQGSAGSIPGTKEFLKQVEESAKKVGAVFILDEVMTSRLAPGGLQSILGLKPDITVLGKYLGGGLAFGAFGGRESIMSVYDPRQRSYLLHSGTFNNNTLTMRTGFAGLSKVYTPEVCTAFNESGEAFLSRLQEVTKGTRCCITGRGTIMTVHFMEKVVNPEDIKSKRDLAEVPELKELFWLEMMEDGYWIASRGAIAVILGTPQEELNRFVGCVEKFLKRHASLVGLN